jgi:hypothetical protein
MAITKSDGSATVSTTEFSFPNNSTTLTPQTTACCLQPYVDVNALAAGDQFRLRAYEKINGTQRVIYEATLTGAQSQAFVFPTLVVMDGWDVTCLKLAGTDRAIAWSLRKVA